MYGDVPAPTGFVVRAENLCPLNGEKMIESIRPTYPTVCPPWRRTRRGTQSVGAVTEGAEFRPQCCWMR
jgi:hypothetical protein